MANRKPKKPVQTHPLAVALADSRGSTRREVAAYLGFVTAHFLQNGAKTPAAARNEAMELMRSVAGCDLRIPDITTLEQGFADLRAAEGLDGLPADEALAREQMAHDRLRLTDVFGASAKTTNRLARTSRSRRGGR